MKSRKRWECLDCAVDCGRIYEHYFIYTKLWLSVVPSIKGMLCILCLENRLKRRLNAKDFPSDIYLNNPKFNKMSARLLSRIRDGC